MTAILVPIDGSEPAFRALDFAVGLMKGQTGDAIHALFVHPPIDVAGKVQGFVTAERMRQLASETSRWILDRADRRLAETSVVHTVNMIEGDPAETIARRAQELECDAIVMGSRGMGLVANVVLGSVANKVVHLTALPVTLVK